jgi:alcohol dehydrogenase (cytochrome c)
MEQFPLMGCIFTPYWDVPVLLRPSASGGSNFNPSSYHPPTGYVFVFGLEQNGAIGTNSYIPRKYESGKGYSRVTNAPVIGANITSTVTAMDSRNNKIVWQKRYPGQNNYGGFTTATGLMFTGQVDGNMTAYNASNGDVLWKFQVGWGISAPPMTYEVDGTQYVAVAAGGNRGGLTTLDGDAVWAFSLNGPIDQVAAPPPIDTKVTLTGNPVRLGGEVGNPTTTLGGTWIFEGTVRTLDFRFDPMRIQVPVGTTVNWDNMGGTIHTVTAQKGGFDSGDIAAGATFSVTFDSAGSYIYFCSPHPWMIGEVLVQ